MHAAHVQQVQVRGARTHSATHVGITEDLRAASDAEGADRLVEVEREFSERDPVELSSKHPHVHGYAFSHH